MKRKILANICLLMCMICSCKTDLSNQQLNNETATNCEYNGWNYVVFGNGGYYLLCDGLIAFWDGDVEHKATPICSRPDCDHELPECPAHIAMGSCKKLFYVDGYLYLFGAWQEHDPVTQAVGYPLWRVAADGSSKEIALVVREMPNLYTIFQDKVYYESQTEDENGKIICSVSSLPLGGGEETQIFRSQYQNSGMYMMQGMGDTLYFKEGGIDMSLDLKDPELDLNGIVETQVLHAYDPKTGELKSDPFHEKEGYYSIIRNVYGGKIYYSFWKDETQNELWSRKIDGGEETLCFENTPPMFYAADSEYLYTTCIENVESGQCEVNIYDYQGEIKQKFLIPLSDRLHFIPATGEYVFGLYERMTNPEEGQVEYSIVLLQREKIADGTAELIPLIQK